MSKQIDLHVLQFYEPKKLLGSGAYGHVWKVINKQTKQVLALKKIFDAFQNSTDAQRTYREISLLHEMQHQNIIKLHKVIKAKNKKDLYLVFEFMQSDLHSLVGEDILTPAHLKFVLYQILKALKYIHSAQLIHRDLKPSNILINSDCQIKLCDFGLARSLAHEENQENILSEQVATRWYRSPQILLNSKQYSKPTDIWSVGCIVAELLIGQPIFQGNSTLNQLEKIVEFTGMPSKYNIDSLKSDVAENILNSLSARKKSIKDYFRIENPQTRDLVQLTTKMLQFNPNKRPTIEQLFKHKMFAQFEKNASQQTQICQKFIIPSVDDNVKLSLQQYRSIIYKDIQRRYPEFNDNVRMKGVYSVIKKTNSFVQKGKNNKSISRQKGNTHVSNQKSQTQVHGNTFNVLNKEKQHRSLHKNNESMNKSSSGLIKNKKSVGRFGGTGELNHDKFIEECKKKLEKENIKAKAVKIPKEEHLNTQVKEFNKQNYCQIKQNMHKFQENYEYKQAVKNYIPNNDLNQNKKVKKGVNNENGSLFKIKEKKLNQSNGICQNMFADKSNVPLIQEKAAVYKNELKRMKSSKGLLCKVKPSNKPRFNRSFEKMKVK